MNIHPKVAIGGLAAALTTIIVTEANRRGIPIDGNEGAAIATVVGFFAGYLTPDNPPPPAPPPTPGP